MKQKRKINSPSPPSGGDDSGPKAPDVQKPNVDELLKKMKKIDRDVSERYKQRGGQ